MLISAVSVSSEASEGGPSSAVARVGAGVAGPAGAGGGAVGGGAVGRAWYFGAITRTHCDALLNQHGHDGDFLIRDSETNVCISHIRTSPQSMHTSTPSINPCGVSRSATTPCR